jgi:hypothetical protein
LSYEIASVTALPDSAAQWQSTFDAIHNGSWSGSDGAHSALLPDGRDLVIYGDTFGGSVTSTGARSPDPPFFPNSMGIASRNEVAWVNKAGQPAIPVAADGTVYWPEAVAATGRTLYVFVNRVRRAGNEVEGIRVVGQSLATFDIDTWTLQSMTTLGAADDERGSGIWWSAGASVDGSDVYVYGVHHKRGDYGRSVYVARVPVATVTQRSSWRYWDGAAWTKNRQLPPAAQLIREEADTVVSVWHTGTTWYLVSQKYGLLGRDIELWTAPSPQGPWTDTKVLYSIPPCEYPDAIFYEGAAHPEVPLASGNLLLSYSRNGSHDHIHADANWYKPQYVEAAL